MKKLLNLSLAITGLVVLTAGSSFAGTVGGLNPSSAFGWYSKDGLGKISLTGNEAISKVSTSVDGSVGFGQWKVKVKDAKGNIQDFWYSVQDGTDSDGTLVKQETFVSAGVAIAGADKNDAKGTTFKQQINDANGASCNYDIVQSTACFKTTMDFNGLGTGNVAMNINMVITEPNASDNTAGFDFRTQFDFNQEKEPGAAGKIDNDFTIKAGISKIGAGSTDDYTQTFGFVQKQASLGVDQSLNVTCQEGDTNCPATGVGSELTIIGDVASSTSAILSGTDPTSNKLVQIYFDDNLELNSGSSTQFKWESINVNPTDGGSNDYKYQVF